jgi:hypothetical protein
MTDNARMTAQPSIRTELRPISALNQDDWEEIRGFGSRYFEGAFDASMRAKQELVLLRAASGAIVGIGAVELFDLCIDGRRASFIHAGNAAFADETRGQSQVQKLGFRYFLRAKRRHPLRPVYLVYTTFSWRSYLMLTRNFARSWPRPGQALPRWEAAVYAELGRRLLGERYDATVGVARNLDRRLRPDIAQIPPHLAADPDLRYFIERNPGYASGDVLLCLAPLDAGNWLAVARRMLRRRRSPARLPQAPTG